MTVKKEKTELFKLLEKKYPDTTESAYRLIIKGWNEVIKPALIKELQINKDILKAIDNIK